MAWYHGGPLEPNQDSIEVVLPPCPQCGGVLRLEFKFKVKVVSLAGTQMKLGATPWPFLVCDCGFTEEGKVE